MPDLGKVTVFQPNRTTVVSPNYKPKPRTTRMTATPEATMTSDRVNMVLAQVEGFRQRLHDLQREMDPLVAQYDNMKGIYTDDDQQIASLKASVELQKIEMKAALDGVTQQYQQIMQAMNTTGQMAPQLEQLAGAVAQLAQGSAQSNEMSAMQMQTLMDKLSRKTKRVPIRDENGDIVEVREVEDDAPDGMAMLPQPQGAMNAGFVG